MTPVMMACALGDDDSLKRLLKEPNCSINVKNKIQLSALHFAVMYQHPSCVRLLMAERSCQPFEVNSFGETPLDLAISMGDDEIISQFDQTKYRNKVISDPNEITRFFQKIARWWLKRVRWY